MTSSCRLSPRSFRLKATRSYLFQSHCTCCNFLSPRLFPFCIHCIFEVLYTIAQARRVCPFILVRWTILSLRRAHWCFQQPRRNFRFPHCRNVTLLRCIERHVGKIAMTEEWLTFARSTLIIFCRLYSLHDNEINIFLLARLSFVLYSCRKSWFQDIWDLTIIHSVVSPEILESWIAHRLAAPAAKSNNNQQLPACDSRSHSIRRRFDDARCGQWENASVLCNSFSKRAHSHRLFIERPPSIDNEQDLAVISRGWHARVSPARVNGETSSWQAALSPRKQSNPGVVYLKQKKSSDRLRDPAVGRESRPGFPIRLIIRLRRRTIP